MLRKMRLRQPEAYRFNVMVVGESGLGKSTFLRTLFKGFVADIQKLVPSDQGSPESADVDAQGTPRRLDKSKKKTTSVREIGKIEIQSGNTLYILTVIDTPGYGRPFLLLFWVVFVCCLVHFRPYRLFLNPSGDYIDNNKSFAPIEDFIMAEYERYREMQVSLDFREYDRIVQDGRVHCCFYFIAPHRIKPLDIEFMNRLQKQVIIVPILAKADTMTIAERRYR
jgi:septin 3/9/12